MVWYVRSYSSCWVRFCAPLLNFDAQAAEVRRLAADAVLLSCFAQWRNLSHTLTCTLRRSYLQQCYHGSRCVVALIQCLEQAHSRCRPAHLTRAELLAICSLSCAQVNPAWAASARVVCHQGFLAHQTSRLSSLTRTRRKRSTKSNLRQGESIFLCGPVGAASARRGAIHNSHHAMSVTCI